MSTSEETDVCLLLGREELQEKFTREINTMVSAPGINITLLLIDEETKNDGSVEEYSGFQPKYVIDFFQTLSDKGPRTLIWAEAYLASLFTRENTAFEELRDMRATKTYIDNIEGLEETERLYFTPNKTGEYTYKIPADIVNKITSQADVVLLLGFNKILRGQILSEPEYGTLSLHWSDIRKYRGRPGCFWQFMNGENTIGVTLQQLTEDLDGGYLILCEHADIRDASTWFEVRLRAAEMYGSMFTEGLRRLRDPEFEPERLGENELGVMTYESDGYNPRKVAKMIIKNFIGRVIK